VHGLHVTLGMLMLAFAACLPELEPARRPPHRPLHNAALYWHFVDLVWVVIVALLYVAPRV
jgi:heme/copper-type cytochrome/quinol oxidase subunit 3